MEKLTIVNLLIYTLATWRISSLISAEEGPFNIFNRLRQLLSPYSFFTSLIECIWCLSVWVAIAWVVFIALFPTIAAWIALPFALSAGAIIVEGITTNDYEE